MKKRPVDDPAKDNIAMISAEDRERIRSMLLSSRRPVVAESNPAAPQWNPSEQSIADVWIIEHRLRAERSASEQLVNVTNNLVHVTGRLATGTVCLVVATVALAIVTGFSH